MGLVRCPPRRGVEFTHQLEVGGRGQGARCHWGQAVGALRCLCLPPNGPGQSLTFSRPRPPLKHKQVVSDNPKGRLHLSYSVFKTIRRLFSTCYRHTSLYWRLGWENLCACLEGVQNSFSGSEDVGNSVWTFSSWSPTWLPSCPHRHIIRFAVAILSDMGLFAHVYLLQQQMFVSKGPDCNILSPQVTQSSSQGFCAAVVASAGRVSI